MNKNAKWMVYIVALTAALAGLLFGLDIGVISGALPFIGKHFGASDIAKEWIVSSLLVGAVLGTLVSGFISRKYGRKNTIIVSAIIFAIGAVLSSIANSVPILIGVRVFLGIAVGIASFTAPLYLSEMAPQKIRGRLISMYQLMITIGILLAFLSDTWLSYGGHWRIMLGILVIPSTVLFIGVLFLPKSPRWLFLVGRKAEAREVLNKLRESIEEVELEIDEIESGLKAQQNGVKMISNPNFRKALFLGIGLQIMQQFTGMNVVMYYAPQIFKDAGFATTAEQMWGTVLVGLINVLATFFAIAFVDKLGRKPILAIGFFVMGISMTFMGWMFHIGVETSSLVQFSAIIALLLFIIGFAMSAGPIIWVLCSEIYPLQGRDLGITISTATNWICNTIVGATFLTLLNNFGDAKTFFLFGGMNIVFIFVLLRFAPETKGVSLEKIEKNLMSGMPINKIGR